MSERKSPDSSSKTSSASSEDPRMKPRHLETRILYSDHDSAWQKKLLSLAREAVQAMIDKGVETEQSFFQEVAALLKEALAASSEVEKTKKWHFVVGNDFNVQAEAVKDSISFFAIGDVKFLVYRTQN
ncbi:hypothetical protein GCK72_002341 [Caenorhabditis remanei]|uniref:Dynein light chain n=1 Tax=Caenorhabditis remanei TaxID=31234 RepID=A0A6A5HX65_CAERE|nr:hypothetical protein GCK72_002341 [Caenorhabditis remanei]KAF1770522.1 hypothetical protein GCK72_002341 [Caenorhabditis remanei]